MKTEYVIKNFHKFSHRHRFRIALAIVEGKRLPNIKIEKRDRNDPRLYTWRKSVYERDNYTCQECGVRGVVINAHHIKKWSDYPELRFELDNGLTLCKSCHRKKHERN